MGRVAVPGRLSSLDATGQAPAPTAGTPHLREGQGAERTTSEPLARQLDFLAELDRMPLLLDARSGGGTWTESGVDEAQVLADFAPLTP